MIPLKQTKVISKIYFRGYFYINSKYSAKLPKLNCSVFVPLGKSMRLQPTRRALTMKMSKGLSALQALKKIIKQNPRIIIRGFLLK